MKSWTGSRNIAAAAAVVSCLAAADRAEALCVDGTTVACTYYGHPGTRECVNGYWTPCQTDEPVGPQPISAPTVPSRTSNSLTVRWSSTLTTGESYQLQSWNGYAWMGLSNVGSPATYVHSGLQPDRKYCYRVAASGPYGSRASSSACRYTTDGTGRKAWRIEAQFHTGNVEDAGTDDSIRVLLNEAGTHSTWVDYGRDDFERGDTFTYDLGLERLDFFSDINRIRLEKTGTDGWCLADFTLLVNGVPVYSESFSSLPAGCRWIDGNDGHQPFYEVGHAAIRAHAGWQGYVEPLRIVIDQSAYPRITATVRVPRAETESRIESMMGDLIHGTEAHWGDRHGDRHVEASWGGQTARLNLDLDLEASVDNWFDPELDIDFDLVYQARCSADQTQVIVDVATENLQAQVDFDWFLELVSILTPCTPVVSVIDGEPVNCISKLETYIGNAIEAGFTPIVQSQRQSLPQGVRCLSGNVEIDANANVSLVFQLEAPPPTPIFYFPITPIFRWP